MGPITDAHKLTYQRNVQLAVQQLRSLLEAGFTYAGYLAGRQAQMLELMGASEAIIDGTRGGDTPNIDSNIEPVWVRPRQIEWGKVIEKEDAIKALTDYQSPFVQVGAAAVKRAKDTILASAIFGDRLIGQDGTTVQSYDSASGVRRVTEGIGASATDDTTATGMNVRKILRGKRLFQAEHIDLDQEKLVCFLNAKEIEDLYRDITFVSKDYRDKAVLEGRQVLEVADVKIIHTEGLANVDGDTHCAAMACMSGLHWGEFSPIETKVEPNPAKKYRPHPYMETWLGATRSEDKKVVEIYNKF